MLHVGSIARELRESLGLTQHEAAIRLGVTNVHVSNIENNKSFPSHQLIERYRREFGVDLYILAWCKQSDNVDLPKSIRESAEALARAWLVRYEEIVEQHKRGD